MRPVPYIRTTQNKSGVMNASDSRNPTHSINSRTHEGSGARQIGYVMTSLSYGIRGKKKAFVVFL